MYSLTDTEILMRARTAASVLRHLGRSLCSVPFKHEVLSLLQAIHLLLAFYLVRVRSDFFTQFISQRYGVIIFLHRCLHERVPTHPPFCWWASPVTERKIEPIQLWNKFWKNASTCAKLKTQIRVGKFHHKNCYQLRYTRSKYRMIYSGRCKRHFISLYWEKKSSSNQLYMLEKEPLSPPRSRLAR